MAGPEAVPVVDHHCHLSPSGEGVRAAARFRAAGGTHLFLATQSYGPSPPTTVDGYAEQFDTTERLAAEVRRETGVAVRLVLAPFPVDLVDQVGSRGGPAAVALHRGALDEAAARVREGRAVALGEVGWPHFPTSEEVRWAAETVFDHALGLARDTGCPLLVHSDDLGPEGYRAISERAARAGLPPARIIKHYARTPLPAEDRHGVPPSFVATRPLVEFVRTDPGPWFLETDFLDDPRRPGAVLDLATIPRRFRALQERDEGTMAAVQARLADSFRASYGFAPSLDDLGDR